MGFKILNGIRITSCEENGKGTEGCPPDATTVDAP